MATRVSGSISVEGNQAVVVLAVAVGRGEPPAQLVPPLQTCVNKILEGKFPIYESPLPVLKKHVAGMVSWPPSTVLRLAPAICVLPWIPKVLALEDAPLTAPLFWRQVA